MKKIRKVLTLILIACIFSAMFSNKFSLNISAQTLNDEDVYTDSNVYTRATEYTITDSGRFNQPLDRITTSDYTYSPTEMKNNYMYVKITLQITIREINDGYQHIFIYNGVESNSTLLGSKQIEHGSGVKDTTYKIYTVIFENISLSSFSTNDIVVRFGASGSSNDNWHNKNLSITLAYSHPILGNYSNNTSQTTYDYIRNAEYIITDSGRFNQPLDRITTSDYNNAPLDMKHLYMYVNIILQIDIKEISDGYQYFALYNGVENTSTLLAEQQFEHYPGDENTNYKTYTIAFDSIPLNKFYSNDIVIRYGASGVDNDDWANKNLKVSLEYINDNEKFSLDIKYSEHISAGETKEFIYYLSDEMYYVVETRGNLDTYLTIEGLGSTSLTNDDGGIGNNACIGFKGIKGWITIKLRFFSSTLSGTTELQIRKQQAVMYGFDYGGTDIDTTSDLTDPYIDLRNTYYTHKFSYNTQHTPSHMLSLDARNYARINSEVVFFTGHGNIGGVYFPSGWLNSYELTNMENTKIAVWAACYSSKSNEYEVSMTQASINAGAKSAVRWPVTTTTISSKTFTNRLFSKLASGATIQEACAYADNGIIWPWDNIHDYEIFGSNSTTIAYNIPNKASFSMSNLTPLINSFEERYEETNNWSTFEINGETRVYRTINGCITNDFYIIKKENGNIVDIKHSGVFVDNAQIQPIVKASSSVKKTIMVDSLFMNLSNTRSYVVYYTMNNVLVPIEIKYCTYISEKGFAYEEAICTNLNNGNEISYEEICG